MTQKPVEEGKRVSTVKQEQIEEWEKESSEILNPPGFEGEISAGNQVDRKQNCRDNVTESNRIISPVVEGEISTGNQVDRKRKCSDDVSKSKRIDPLATEGEFSGGNQVERKRKCSDGVRVRKKGFRHFQNCLIRHRWMTDWFLHIPSIEEVKSLYHTTSSIAGSQRLVQHLLGIAKEALTTWEKNWEEYRLETGSAISNIDRGENVLRQMCCNAAVQWTDQWKLWLECKFRFVWTDSDMFIWQELNENPNFKEERVKLATELEGWFAANKASGKVMHPQNIRTLQNATIRHRWMTNWFLHVVNIDQVKNWYDTPVSSLGSDRFIDYLFGHAKQALKKWEDEIPEESIREIDRSKIDRDETGLRNLCRMAATTWATEWKLWLGSKMHKAWTKQDEGKSTWLQLNMNPNFKAERENLATELEVWSKSCRPCSQKHSQTLRHSQNASIRHHWMANWFVNVVNIQQVKTWYDTPGSTAGRERFIYYLMGQAQLALKSWEDSRLQRGVIVADRLSMDRDEVSLRDMCLHSALSWTAEWKLWLGCKLHDSWVNQNDQRTLRWQELIRNPNFKQDRENLARELAEWFKSTGSVCSV